MVAYRSSFRLCGQPPATAIAFRKEFLNRFPGIMQCLDHFERRVIYNPNALAINQSTHIAQYHLSSEPCSQASNLNAIFNTAYTPNTGHLYVHALPRRTSSSEASSSDVDTPPTRPTAITFRLTYAKEDELLWTDELWTGHDSIRCRANDSVLLLPAHFHRAINARVQQDSILVQDAPENQFVLVFSVSIHVNGWNILLHNNALQFNTVDDLVTSAHTDGAMLEVVVRLRPGSTDNSIVDGSELTLVPEPNASRYNFWRLGSLDVAVDDSEQEFSGQTVRQEEAVLARRDVGDQRGVSQKVCRIASYDFGSHHVGDCDASSFVNPRNVKKWMSNYSELCKPDSNGQELSDNIRELNDDDLDAEIVDLVNEHVSNGFEEQGWRVPILPYHMFIDYDPSSLQRAQLDFPENGIHVAIKCISHLEGADSVVLPRYVTFPVLSDMHIDVLRDWIEMELKAVNQADARTSSLLFQEPINGSWDMQIWVLPQGMDTMFMSSPARGADYWALEKFLLATEENDGRLYVEAHIIAKPGF